VWNPVYDETLVAVTARAAPDNPAPHYPLSLPETLRFLQSPDPGFSESVEAALAHSRFYPAMLGGRPVSQLVRQSFTFMVE
jgi:hypothetical protein